MFNLLSIFYNSVPLTSWLLLLNIEQYLGTWPWYVGLGRYLTPTSTYFLQLIPLLLGMITDLVMVYIVVSCTMKLRSKLRADTGEIEVEDLTTAAADHKIKQLHKTGRLAFHTCLLNVIPLLAFFFARYSHVAYNYCTRGVYVTGIQCFDHGRFSNRFKEFWDSYLVLIVAICANISVFVYCAISSSYRAVVVDTAKKIVQLMTCYRIRYTPSRVAPVEDEVQPPETQELENVF